MLGFMFRVQMNGYNLVPYNFSIIRGNDLAMKIIGWLNFKGAKNLYTAEFERLMTGKEVSIETKFVVSSNTLLQTQAK